MNRKTLPSGTIPPVTGMLSQTGCSVMREGTIPFVDSGWGQKLHSPLCAEAPRGDRWQEEESATR